MSQEAQNLLSGLGVQPGDTFNFTYDELVALVGGAMRAGRKRVRDGVFSNLGEGSHCPTCDQYARRYKRKLNSSMARGLIWLYKATDDFIHVRQNAPRWLATKGGDFAVMRHWGLIEEKPHAGTDKKTSGIWRITQAGVAFVQIDSVLHSHAYLYNDEFLGFWGELVSIKDALGEHFHYQELMNE